MSPKTRKNEAMDMLSEFKTVILIVYKTFYNSQLLLHEDIMKSDICRCSCREQTEEFEERYS